ncbi:MAG: OmpA family protein, partial [Oricola sp.]
PEQPAAEEPVTEQPAAEEPAPEQPAAEMVDPETAAPAGEPVQVTEPEQPQLVVPDNLTDEQRTTIQAEEQQRRDDARDRRGELLGAAAIGAAIGILIPALGGTVVEDQGDRIIVERDGEYYVRKDESSLLRDGDVEVTVQRLRGGLTREIVTRRDGVQIVTIRDSGGYILRRSRVLPDGREYVIIDNGIRDDRTYVDYDRRLPPLRIDIPRDRYIVPARQADRDVIYQTFIAPPVEPVENAYTLREVRESERLRAKVRRVDLDTVTFETGSAIVRESEVQQLEELARASLALIDRDPSTVLLVEGHTDAVGSEVSNLALSDRRAETVAWILATRYDVPPENMVVQGYGEQFLKINTQRAEQQNLRVTIRNITPLLSAGR